MYEIGWLVHGLIHDATVFIGFCTQVIAVAALHVYTTALASVPRSFMIACLYMPRFRNLLGEVGQVVRKANCYS